MGPFNSTASLFRDTRLWKIRKIGNAHMTLQDMEHLAVKSTLSTLSTYPYGKILLPSALRAAIFKISHIL